MIPDPLHPSLVHFPIVLAVLLPMAVLVAWFAIRKGSNARATWSIVVVLSLVLFASAFVTSRSGEAQEDTVEKVLASEVPLHSHEEAAERFIVIVALTFGLSTIGLLGGRVGRVGRVAMIAGSLATAASVYPVGRSGGELVYDHGAAAAYSGTTQSRQAGVAPGAANARSEGQAAHD